MESLITYLFVLDLLSNHPFKFLIGVSLVWTVISCLLWYFFDYQVTDEPLTSKLKYPILAFIICLVLNWVIPEKETMYLMGAALGIQELSETEGVKQLTGDAARVYTKSLNALEAHLDSLN